MRRCEEVDNVAIDLGAGQPYLYCGSRRPPLLMSAGSQMHITFTAVTSSTAAGFSATFAFVTGERTISTPGGTIVGLINISR